MAKPQIEPRILKGFRDLLPNEAAQRIELFEMIRGVFNSACYLPIDTPALEYTEILLGKGSDETDKQLFRFQDQGGRDIALRFDLTVPLARYVSQHRNDLTLPFKRYHIAPVWRAEKPQKGRYREFYQCDFDIIGTKNISSDIDTLITIGNIFEQIGLKYNIRINHRVILNSVIKFYAPDANETAILRIIDKLDKLGIELVKKELIALGSIEEGNVINLLKTITDLKNEKDLNIVFGILDDLLKNIENTSDVLKDCKKLFSTLNNASLKNGSYTYDISIARGLDYYTGIVFETQLVDFPDLGSVCSGGRYDNLALLFSSQELPGVGGSVGIDRLLVALENTQFNFAKEKPTKILITVFSDDLIGEYFKLANTLRANNFSTEIYSGNGKLGNQLKYANKGDFDYAIIIGENEAETNSVIIKDLKTASEDNQHQITQDNIISFFKAK